MATAAESAYNLRTVARRVADALGIKDSRDMTLVQRTAYNRALIAEILKYPNGFTSEIRNRAAAMNTDYGYRGNYFDSALGTVATSVTDTVRAINPLDPQNIAITGKWLLVAVALLAAFWLLINRRPSSPA